MKIGDFLKESKESDIKKLNTILSVIDSIDSDFNKIRVRMEQSIDNAKKLGVTSAYRARSKLDRGDLYSAVNELRDAVNSAIGILGFDEE